MTNSNARTEMIGASIGSQTSVDHNFELPNDYRKLAAMKAAIETKMADMQTAGAEALRKKIADESAALGMSPEEIVGGVAGKKRGRKPRQKSDE